MNEIFSRQRLREEATFGDAEFALLGTARGEHNRLGLGYQLVFAKVLNCLPQQNPFEIENRLAGFAAGQLEINVQNMETYAQNRFTIGRHQDLLLKHLGSDRFSDKHVVALEKVLFSEAQRVEDTAALVQKARDFLRLKKILCPTQYALVRIIGAQRKRARDAIYTRVWKLLNEEKRKALRALVVVGEEDIYSPLHFLKQNPAKPSPEAALALVDRLGKIKESGVLDIDIGWLNANRVRSLYRYVNNSSAHSLGRLEEHRYVTALVCFLRESYCDTVDHLIVVFGRILRGVSSRAENEIAEQVKKQGKTFRKSLGMVAFISEALLDEEIDAEQKIARILDRYPEEELNDFCKTTKPWLTGKLSHSFHAVIKRFTYLRRFTPAFLQTIDFRQSYGETPTPISQALQLLKDANENNTRKVPEDAPLDFVPKNLRHIVCPDGKIDRHAWECVLLLKLNEELRKGNFHACHSKRFATLEDYFIETEQWEKWRGGFFARSGLPADPAAVPEYLRLRLNRAYESYFATADTNTFVRVKNEKFEFTSDPAQQLSEKEEYELYDLKLWLDKNLPKIRLPDLLIEVDNRIHFTRHFQNQSAQADREPQSIRALLATIMAHGCNLGLTTTPDLIEGVTYSQLKRISDWQLTPEAHRHALGDIVKSFTNLDITLHWGEGKTAAADGQRFNFLHKVLQRTYSTRFQDFALEFYSFVADNYAPFFSSPKECQDRDSAHLLDGLLYNESDLEITELYTDHHGYTDLNFAAFAFLGMRSRPRIRGLKDTRLYHIDAALNYHDLAPIVTTSRHLINPQQIAPHWDKAAHLFASIEAGHITAATAMRRLVAISPSNHLARACLLFGQILKTEHILQFISDPGLRTHIRQTLLKVEELHSLYRNIYYAYRGRVAARQLHAQGNACSCLTLIAACIIHWQASQISRLLKKYADQLPALNLNPSAIAHISPISWKNVIIYGQYNLNTNRIK